MAEDYENSIENLANRLDGIMTELSNLNEHMIISNLLKLAEIKQEPGHPNLEKAKEKMKEMDYF